MLRNVTVLCVMLCAPFARADFFEWTDNSITALPVGGDFALADHTRLTLTYEHAHASRLGDMFIFVDGSAGYDGELTWYGEIAPRLSLGKVTGKDLSFGPVTDTLLAFTWEQGEHASALLAGVGFDFKVPRLDYFQVNLYGRSELYGEDAWFDDAQLTVATAFPFEVKGERFLLDGYFDFVPGISGPPEFHLNPQLSWDAGAHWGKPGTFFVGVEIDLWWNKFGVDDGQLVQTGTTSMHPDHPKNGNHPEHPEHTTPVYSRLDSNQQAVSLLFKAKF